MYRRSAIQLAVMALAAAACYGAQGTAPLSRAGLADLKAATPVTDCPALLHAAIKMPADAPLQITGASVVDESPTSYCRVTGTVAPEVRIEVRLPLKTWTQRFVMTGCGGLCGNLNIHLGNDFACAPAQNGELALAATDMGHQGGMDASWAAGHPERVIDFAYRSIHVTAVAAKSLMATFYGKQPRFSYFAGCSDGGREALMEAERYPDDFDGITAGAPAMNFMTQNTFYHGWNVLRNRDENGKVILTAAQLPVLHKAAIEACDALDGLKDGLISDPTRCHFDPASIQCKAGQDEATCLTAQQARVAADIYQGAHDAQGRQLVISGPQYGSELAWEGVFIPRGAGGQSMSSGISTGTFRFLTSWQTYPSRTLADLHFDEATLKSFTPMHEILDATDPDLASFAGKNHKLILWHGWQDPHISPLNTIAYYTAMERTMAQGAVQRFARLYLFPGGYHCAGGEGPFNMDLLQPIVEWVESGIAPNKIVAWHKSGGPAGPPGREAGGKIDRTRPVFPYPQVAVYRGNGSTDDEANFAASAGTRVDSKKLEWLGSGFYSAGFHKWCNVKAGTAACTSKKSNQ